MFSFQQSCLTCESFWSAGKVNKLTRTLGVGRQNWNGKAELKPERIAESFFWSCCLV